MIKAIDTVYNGYRFRSRLEARWAVYFDTLGLEWEYEPEGFNLDGVYYLPDFWIPLVGMWAEVKAEEFSEDELNKARCLANESGYPVLMLIGTPDFKSYWAYLPDYEIEGEDYPDMIDFILDDNYLDERRSFHCTGADYPDSVPADSGMFQSMARPVEAARSARFEHKEKHQ